MSIQKVGDFGGKIVFRHVDNGRGRASKPEKLYLIQSVHTVDAPWAASAGACESVTQYQRKHTAFKLDDVCFRKMFTQKECNRIELAKQNTHYSLNDKIYSTLLEKNKVKIRTNNRIK